MKRRRPTKVDLEIADRVREQQQLADREAKGIEGKITIAMTAIGHRMNELEEARTAFLGAQRAVEEARRRLQALHEQRAMIRVILGLANGGLDYEEVEVQ